MTNRRQRTCRGTALTRLRTRQVVGKWRFLLGGLNETQSTNCFERGSVQFQSQRVFALTEPDVAIDEGGARGFWTMVYDEGFEVHIGGMKVSRRGAGPPPLASPLRRRAQYFAFFAFGTGAHQVGRGAACGDHCFSGLEFNRFSYRSAPRRRLRRARATAGAPPPGGTTPTTARRGAATPPRSCR